MKPSFYLLLASLGLLFATVLVVAVLSSRPEEGPVYSVKELQMNLEHDPESWVGRAVWVRGVAWPCLGWAYGPCLVNSPILTDLGAEGGLALARQPTNLLFAFVRAAPVVGKLVPQEQKAQWGVLASYRVQIRAVTIASCTYWPCYKAVLLDAVPGKPSTD